MENHPGRSRLKMGEIGFALSHYGAAALLLLLAYQFGRRLTLRLKYHSALEEFSFSTTLGLGAIAYLIMFLGLAGLLYKPVIAVALAAGSAACYQIWIDLFRRLKSVPGRLRSASRVRVALWAAVIIAGLVLSIPFLQMPLYPPTAFDALSYHLPTAKTYAENHRLVFTPYLRYAVFPQTPHMLFTLALIFYDDVLAQLIMFMSLLILLGAVIAFGRRYFSARAGWWAAALMIAHALVLEIASIAYVDMLLMLIIMTAVYAFWNWTQEKDTKWIAMAGALCGLAITVKYTAGFFLLLIGLVAAYRGFRDRSLRPSLILWISALIVAFPWLARNFYYTRNPVYPFFYGLFASVFGHGHMRPEYYIGFFEDISAYGIGKNIQSLVTLPWHMTFGHASFLSDKPLAPYLLFALPVLLVGVFRNRHIRWLAIVTLAFTLFWFFTIQVDRYWMPVLPLLNLAIIASLDDLLRWKRAVQKYTSHALTICLVIVLLGKPGWDYAIKTTQEAGPAPTNGVQRDRYLARMLHSYNAYKLLNEKGRPNYTIYAIQDENLNYYAKGKHIGDYFGPARYSLIWDKLGDGKALYETLKGLGVDYFLVNNQRNPVPLARDETFRRYFSLIHSQGNVLLFDISDDSIKRVIGPQLLINPGFESITAGLPTGWAAVGRPVIDTSARESHTGASAVRCIGAENVFYQPVAIKSGETYSLSYSGRGIDWNQTARMQINWSDAQGQFMTTDLQVIKLGPEWGRYEMTVSAPEHAAYAVVYASCHDTGSAWLDDFSFTTLRLERR